jgi:tetratricopeptide (TPR) repeat protein
VGELSRLLVEIFQAPEVDLAASWREPLKAGDVVGRYQIKAEIGRGGFGAVYEAFDPELGRTVALKALKPGRTRKTFSEEWIKREAEAVAKLDHSAIVTIHDVGTCPAGAYLVMELLRGETLARRIEKGPLPVDEALRIAEQMAEGLAHAHSRGVLHRDLKPANVFVCEDGRVKLLDFGLAHLLGTEGSSGAGTPAYMAPEQAAGSAVDERADVWAAGMVLGEMLTGKRPVERTPSPAPGAESSGPKTELMWEAPKDAPQPAAATPGPRLTGVPRPAAKVMAAALSEDPAGRPKDGGSWLSELRSARLLVDRPRRLRRLALVGTAFLLLGLAVAGLATWRIWERQIPGGRPTIAVADFVNETGEKELDSISGLLITSLEQGTQLRVLTRGRMVDVLKQLGKGSVDRIDETLAREVGRETRANALLLASIRKLGDAYVVEMRALDPLHDEYVFTVSDRANGKSAVFDLVDRLGAATRKRLGTRDAAAPPPPRVASITTGNPKAWALLFQSRKALDLDDLAAAQRLAEEAVKEDPEFALAHHQLAIASFWHGNTPDYKTARVKYLEAAEARADRLPEKERLTLRVLRAVVDERHADAVRLAEEAAAAYPLDKDVVLQAGDVHWHQEEPAAAMPYFERVLQLDPDHALATDHLLEAAMWSGQMERYLPLAERRAAASTNMEEMESVANALLGAGREVQAREVLDRAVGLGAPPRILTLWHTYLIREGHFDEAERVFRAEFIRVSSDGVATHARWLPTLSWILSQTLCFSGRMREAREAFELVPRKPLKLAEHRGDVAMTKGSADEYEAAAAEQLALQPELRGPELDADMAGLLAWLGDRSRAINYASRARSNPGWDQPLKGYDRRSLEATLAWAEGRTAEAKRTHIGEVQSSHLIRRYWGHIHLGTIALHEQDCPATVEHFEAARALPWPSQPYWRSAHLPLLLQRLATCYEKMGDLTKARERNNEMLKRWEKADEDIPLLVEAKALRERLAGVAGGANSPR